MKHNKHVLYLQAYHNTTVKAQELLENNKEADYGRLLKQLIFYGVRAVNTQPRRENFTREQAEMSFNKANAIISSMGTLMPGELIELFPIDKVYDGDKWETKDYFYTRDYMNTLDPNKPIGNALPLLCEYMNRDLMMFNVHVMGFLDDLRSLEGKPSVFEEWAGMKGLKTYSKHTDQKGNEFMLDRETGKTIKVEKPRPRRRLKLVK